MLFSRIVWVVHGCLHMINVLSWNFVNPFSCWENKCFSMRSNRTGEKPQEMHIMAC